VCGKVPFLCQLHIEIFIIALIALFILLVNARQAKIS